jgi:murein DD-endopeptidase MepM/ murein hydrolase activator NlpD
MRSLYWVRCMLLAVACWLIGAWRVGVPESRAAYSPSAGPVARSPLRVPPERPLLSRPVDERAVSVVPDRFYPYGSTGQGQYQVHHGVEFVNPIGTPVLAGADGTIVVAGSDERQVWGRHLGYYGQLIVIRLDQTYGSAPVYALYGHLSRVHVLLGQQVRRGEEIGSVGSSGVALGPHLHFEIRVGLNAFSHTRNPELWLAPLAGHGTIAGRVQDENGRPVPQTLVTVRPVERLDRYWREAWTYPDAPVEQIRADDEWRENFVMGDVPVGEYVVAAQINGQLYTSRVWVEEGLLTQVSLRAQTADDMLDAHKWPM